MNIAAMVGVATGIGIGLIICVAWFIFANTNRKVKTEYDERQQAIRNVGYKYAFYTVLFYEVIMMILAIGRVELPIVPYAQHFTGIILGCIVLGLYCVIKDVYWGLNNNRKRYLVVFAFTIVLNLIPIIMPAMNGTLFEDGQIGMLALNIMVIIMLAILGVALLVKQIQEGSKKDEED